LEFLEVNTGQGHSQTVYVLGLKSNFRGDSVLKVLQESGFQVIQALASTLDIEASNKFYSPISVKFREVMLGRNLSLAEIGCAISHLEIYQDILDRNLDSAIVLEDDAILTQNFRQIFDATSSFIGSKREAAIFSLFHGKCLIHRWRRTRTLNDSAGNFIRGGGYYPLAIPPYGAVGYVLNREACKKLLQSWNGVIFTADWPLIAISSVKFFVSKRAYVLHPDITTSTVEPHRSKMEFQSFMNQLNIFEQCKVRYRTAKEIEPKSKWRIFFAVYLQIATDIKKGPYRIFSKMLFKNLLFDSQSWN